MILLSVANSVDGRKRLIRRKSKPLLSGRNAVKEVVLKWHSTAEQEVMAEAISVMIAISALAVLTRSQTPFGVLYMNRLLYALIVWQELLWLSYEKKLKTVELNYQPRVFWQANWRLVHTQEVLSWALCATTDSKSYSEDYGCLQATWYLCAIRHRFENEPLDTLISS